MSPKVFIVPRPVVQQWRSQYVSATADAKRKMGEDKREAKEENTTIQTNTKEEL